jgi:hypothetical protein
MKCWMTLLVAGACACATPLLADRASQHRWDGDLDVHESEDTQRSFALTGTAPWHLTIDNITGSIRVAATDQNTIELSVTRVIAARSAEYVAAAKKDVTLDIDESPNGVELYVDGPFRCHCEDGCGGRPASPGSKHCVGCTGNDRCWNNGRDQDRHYRVRYDFVLKVPKAIALCLKTVNDGDIRVDGATGDFDISNVNGAIEMLDIAGSGRARTINRDVRVVFARNPTTASSFATINGNTIVYFQPALAANLRVKTFNGKIFTDFDTAHLAGMAPVAERRDGKFIYKSDRGVGLRVGLGGPELQFETLNGDIRILQRD